MSIFFGFAFLLVVVAFIVGAYQAFTDTPDAAVQPYLKVSKPIARIHPSLEYLDARRKAFEVQVENT